LYHKDQCTENWCINKNTDYFEDWAHLFSKESKEINKKILNMGKLFSKKESYQSKLNKMSVEEGIIFEMENVAYITIMGMINYNYYKYKNVLVIDNQDIVFDFENIIKKILIFFEQTKNLNKIIENSQKLKIQNIINKKYPIKITNTDMERNRYKRYWNKKIDDRFKELFSSNLLEKLKNKTDLNFKI